jgi:hypothetical protein
MGAIQHHDVIQQRRFAVDSLRAPIFRVAAEHHLFPAIHFEHGGGAHLVMGDECICVDFLRRVERLEDLAAKFGVRHNCFGFAGQRPLGSGLGLPGSASCDNAEQQQKNSTGALQSIGLPVTAGRLDQSYGLSVWIVG